MFSVLIFSHMSISNDTKSPQKQSIEFELLSAIEQNNFKVVEEIIANERLNINDFYKGKTFAIWASIHDKPEMLKILFEAGADLNKRCSFGYTIEEHCERNKSIRALAEIIVIKA